MSVLPQVLSLRPTNAVARLGATGAPVLNPRDLLRALEAGEGGPPAALPCLPVYAKAALPGLLAAARSEDAPLGLACLHPVADRGAPERFVEAVRRALEDAPHAAPLFLQAGPIRVAPDADLAQLAEGVFRCVDAGFTLVSLDVSRLDPDAAAAAVRQLAAPVLERELALEVQAPHGAESLVLSELGGAARFLRVAGAGEGDPDVDALRARAEAAAGQGAALSVEELLAPGTRTLAAYVALGARKVDAGAALARAALQAWPAATRELLVERAGGAGLPPAELLSLMEERVEVLDAAARLRLEALSFDAAGALIGALGATRRARPVMDWLAERAGY